MMEISGALLGVLSMLWCTFARSFTSKSRLLSTKRRDFQRNPSLRTGEIRFAGEIACGGEIPLRGKIDGVHFTGREALDFT